MNSFIYWLNNLSSESRTVLSRGLAFFVIIGVVIWAVPKACQSSSFSSSSTYSSENEIDAYVTSKNIIEKILKAPSTAKFQSYDARLVSKSNITYTVVGYVDSQNSFGAMLRSHYIVTLEGSAYNWKVKEVIFAGEKIV